MDITPYLNLVVEKGGSDLFFTADSTPKLKIEGDVTSIGKTVLDADTCKKIAHGIMQESQWEKFEETLECDFAINLPGTDCRFRVNAFHQRGQVGLVLRLIPSSIPAIKDLGLPDVLRDMVMNQRGLILVVGSTGSGKSTTLASMIDHRNVTHSGHILTIEDPIEFSHKNKKSLINQREVGVDTHSYRNALRAAVREAPNVIMVGEIRDRETMETALELCNTGHLVLSTLHANNANQTMERVINLFPQASHKQLLMDLSQNIVALISQRLVKSVEAKRCAAIEIMINTPHIKDLILSGTLHELKQAMEGSGARGMQTFDQALFDLYKAGRIELNEALNNSDSKSDMEARINFG